MNQTRSAQAEIKDPSAWRSGGFGLTVSSDVPLMAPARPAHKGEPVELQRLHRGELADSWDVDLGLPLWDTQFPDGARVSVHEGPAGEHRIVYGDRARYELSVNTRQVRWEQSAAEESAAVHRFLLDTVLWWMAMLLRFELLHASAVRIDGGVMAFMGGTGAGKSSLAIEFIDAGAELFADDVLSIRRENAGVVVYPGPSLMNIPDPARSVASSWAEPIAHFPEQGETWMAVERACDQPAPLVAVLVLDRGTGRRLGARRLDPSPLTFMAHTWGLTNTGDRGQSSFEIFSDLAQSAPTYHLSAGLDASPAAIAELAVTVCEQARTGL